MISVSLRLLLSTCLALAIAGLVPAHAQEPALPAQALQRVTTFFEQNRPARYMEENCQPTTYPGWEGLPLQQCTYDVKGKHDPAPKTAKVIMLNALPDQLARWVVATCMEVTGHAKPRCTGKLSKHIIGQSGAQFPVAGIVFEDLLPPNGHMKVFPFRNGVTVKINGITNASAQQPTAAQIEKSLNGQVTAALKFARIQGTRREDYLANGGTRSVTGLAWLDVTRDLYKAAWGNNRNELMIAWARANANNLR